MRANNQIILTGISEISLLSESIAQIRVQKDEEYDLTDAISTTESVGLIGQGRQLLYLTIYGDRTVPSKEARNYCISEIGSRYKMAEAIVVKSLSQKMVFNFMINVERPSVRTKLFTHVQEAKDWLKSISA